MHLNQRVGGPVLLGGLLMGFVVVLLVCAGIGVLVQVPFLIAFGWTSYLGRVVPQLSPDPWVVATAFVCLVGFSFGSHAFLKWLYSATGTEPRVWQPKWTACVAGLVVLTFTAGIAVIGMIHQTSWIVRSPEPLMSSREAPARMVSSNHLKQMGLATHDFHDTYHELPQARFDANGRALHSWQTQLLPYLEQQNVYRQIDMTKSWNDPANATPMQTRIRPYLHPVIEQTTVDGRAASHYAGNVHVIMSETPRTLESFPAGTSNTILAGEVSGNFRAWGDPLNVRDPRGFGAPRAQRLPQFLMLDASVRSFDPKELEELLKARP
ncbi:MAG: DUF1559 domain-containing protein [Gemmataceae bacterium]